MKLLDLFCGRFGWGRAFAERGWEVVGVDLTAPPEIPAGCTFIQADVMKIYFGAEGISIHRPEAHHDEYLGRFDFICASSPCEQFSVHGMKHFHPNPAYPSLGIQLFNHTRGLCEESGLLYVIENVRAAQAFVGDAYHHAGPFYLWGSGVPCILPGGITKGVSIGSGSGLKGKTKAEITEWRKQFAALQCGGKSDKRKAMTATWATIPPELSHCIASHASRILEQRSAA